ncbi:rhamnulokinase [candidate division KSB1 bacterium]|nr:rhamnulokinase [candidate division KSB1 bacterium]
MQGKSFIAIDLGAESGRVIKATVSDRIKLQPVHRFENRLVNMLGHLYWDLPGLFYEIKKGLGAVAKSGRQIEAIGVDTWGVDFGLIGRSDALVGHPYAYRDSRTDGIMDIAFGLMPKDELYAASGIQFLQFNSVFQLFSMVRQNHPWLDISQRLMFMPDLFHFLLTGQKVSEYTIASTSQLMNAKTRKWEPEIFAKLGLPVDIMAPIVQPGTKIGSLLPSIQAQVDMPAVPIIAPASHDTASAVAAVPAKGENWAYLSSGTWSLMGVEIKEPIINANSLAGNFTNEGGVDRTIRFLRNIMGLWLLQQTRASWIKQGEKLDYAEIVELAKKARPFIAIIDPDDSRFLNPPDMPQAIFEYCRETGQSVPGSKGELARCILESLALKYRFIIDQLNVASNVSIDVLHIVGGGSQNDLLNQFVADATGLPVVAGPVEATALGNVMTQAMGMGMVSSLQEGRELIRRSFDLREYSPQNTEDWNDLYVQFKNNFV